MVKLALLFDRLRLCNLVIKVFHQALKQGNDLCKALDCVKHQLFRLMQELILLVTRARKGMQRQWR